MAKIAFFSQNDFKVSHPLRIKSWIRSVVKSHRRSIDSIEFIFCDDSFLLQINKEYLQHDTFTDIITFDYSVGSTLSGEIYISIDRVKENAISFGEPFERELHRVIIHGVLHLLGYKDKTKAEKTAMRKKEEACLSLLKK